MIGLLLCLVFQACAQQPEKQVNRIIAAKDGYELTEKHFADYLIALQDYEIETGDRPQTKAIIKAELKKAFLEDPKDILKELNMLSEDAVVPSSDLPTPDMANTSFLAKGHQVVRQKLGSDIGQMQFDTRAAADFRAFMANSLLSSKSNSASSGYGSSSYSESSATIQFCADGTFVQALSGYVSIDLEVMSANSGNSTDYMPGYWEVASLPNGMLIILFYSTHPLMLEDSPNGLLPFPVAQYGTDFVALHNGDGYRRTISNCK
jgi:sulfur relay (sulfurtransferase) DsrC/TusE family protein